MTILNVIDAIRMERSLVTISACVCIFLHMQLAHADTASDTSQSSPADPREEYHQGSPNWLRAVGKLKVPGSTYENGKRIYQWEDCSATLVSANGSARADTIVTAWHCLENYSDLSRPIQFTLTAGQDSPIHREAYRFADGGGMYADWAVLRLLAPISSDQATVLPIHPASAESGISIAMAGYSRKTALGDFGNRLTFDPLCSIKLRSHDVIESDCLAQKGASGGAVVQRSDNGTLWFVGVISEGDGRGISRFVPVGRFRTALSH
ncbi:MAG: trypsin-like peptidase domain-containing protein [Pseudomonadota bacterium]